MATSTFYATYDGYLYAEDNGSISDVFHAIVADGKNANAELIPVGIGRRYPGSAQYSAMRGMLFFDTSSIPTNAIISAATLEIYIDNTTSIIPDGFNLNLSIGLGFNATTPSTWPHNPLDDVDYWRALYFGGIASSVAITDATSGYQTFTLSHGYYNNYYITLGGTTKFRITSSLDDGVTLPTTYPAVKYVAFYSSDETEGDERRPRLTVTYVEIPEVTTSAATSVGETTATGNGQVTDEGDHSVTEYGVIWNDDGSDPIDKDSADNYSAGSDIDESGNFTASISGLSASTTYYYRAYATSSDGTGVGDAESFITDAPGAVFSVETISPIGVLATSATCNGDILEDQGYSITQHGVVYKKDGDPGTPADPTTAEGYTQEGAGAEGAFMSEVSGLDEDSIYFYRAYAQTSDDGGHVVYGEIIVIRTGTADNATFFSSASDGYITWIADSPPSYVYNITSDHMFVGGEYGPIPYHKYKSFIYFDTSSIPANAIVTAATLSLGGLRYFQTAGGAFYLEICSGMPDHPADPITVSTKEADYEYEYTPGGGSIFIDEEEDWIIDDYNDITLSATGRGWINTSGTTKFALVPDFVGGIYLRLDIYTSEETEGAELRPRLYVEWVIPQERPTFPPINIGDSWKDSEEVLINVGDEWKLVLEMQINIGDAWKNLAS